MEEKTFACALRVDPTDYRRHSLHGEASIWLEKNCYIDLWIELVHALGAEPLAMLGVALPVDFEGDQWTFVKPSHDELRRLYGIDVQELTLWRPLAEHAMEHLGAGKLLCVETDAHWLPDTAGTDYRQKHTKTSIVMLEVDLAERRMVYLHNAGCYTLEGDDFDDVFSRRAVPDPRLPFFAELVRLDRLTIRSAAELRAMAWLQWPELLARRPVDNPMRRFAQRFEQELPGLRARGLAHYHAWAFGAIRQAGASFELAARWLRWLAGSEAEAANAMLAAAALQFELIASTCKTLILKAARAVASPKPADLGGLLTTLETAWDQAFAALAAVPEPARQ